MAPFVATLIGLQVAGFFVYRLIEDERRNERQNSELSFERVTVAPRGLDAKLLTHAEGATSLRATVGKPSLVHFWATWCAPCRTELPELLEFARSRRTSLVLVSVDESWEVVRHYFGGNPPPEVVLDQDAELQPAFGVSTLPDTYLLDTSGWTIARFHGPKDWSQASNNRGVNDLLLNASGASR